MNAGRQRFTKRRLEALLERVVAELTVGDSQFTSDTTQTEWNLAHHLALAIHRLLGPLDCDVDLRKPGYGGRRPDIVFHKRGVHASNLLVVEVKRDGSPKSKLADLRKIKSYWFAPPLCYRFGAFINVRTGKPSEIMVLENRRYLAQKRVRRSSSARIRIRQAGRLSAAQRRRS